MSIVSKIKEIFIKKYKEETEYREFLKSNSEIFKLKSNNFNVDESMERLKENKNEQYAKILEITAKRIRTFKNPVKEDTIKDIEVLVAKVFNQGKEEIKNERPNDEIELEKNTLVISDAAKNGIQGASLEKQTDTPESRKLAEEANERIKQSQIQQEETLKKANDYYVR